MRFSDNGKEINCYYLVTDNGGGDSVTWWFVCTKTDMSIDIERCSMCKEAEAALKEHEGK